jgi:hypothetical protein
MSELTSPDRRRSRIGRLIETARPDDALAALLDAAASPDVKTRAELARAIGVTRQTVSRWTRALSCGPALDDALYMVDRRDAVAVAPAAVAPAAVDAL